MRGIIIGPLLLAVLFAGIGLLVGLLILPFREATTNRGEIDFFLGMSSNVVAAKEAAVAAQKAASNPVIVHQEIVKEVRIEPNLQYRCVVAPTSVTVEGGIHVWIGETVICGYNLATTGILGPTMTAHLTSEGVLVPVEAVGLEVDVLCATLKAGMN